jgi:hypothetical protein
VGLFFILELGSIHKWLTIYFGLNASHCKAVIEHEKKSATEKGCQEAFLPST